MDRGGGLTTFAALVPVACVVAAATVDLPAEVSAAIGMMPELLAIPVALLALRLGRHRALVAALLVIALHLTDAPVAPATFVLWLHLIVLAVIPDARVLTWPVMLHVGVALASVPLVASWCRRAPEPTSILGAGEVWWTVGVCVAAFLVTLVAALWRRGPTEAALPWLVAAGAVIAFEPQTPFMRPLVLSAAQAILVIAMVEESHRLAFHDRLTGLANRRAFDDRIQRLRGRYAVAMADVDRFKAFNDRWGHARGDEALRLVAAELDRVGAAGSAYRYGGEEFAVVFPDRTRSDVVDALESVRRGIADRGFVVRSPQRPPKRPRRSAKARGGGRRVKLTISIGVAFAGPRRPNPPSVVRAADRALYRAKRAGRNRVVSTGS